MKLKGIKPIEQHFEKLIVVVLAAIFMIVLLMQFAVHPNMIQVSRLSEKTRPGSAYGPVVERARQLDADMTRSDPVLPDVKSVDIASDFRLAITQGVSPRERLAIGIKGQDIEISDGNFFGPAIGGTKYVEFVPPALTDLVVGNVMNTLSPLDVAGIPGLADLVPAQQPYDKAVITVQGVFDGKALAAMLSTDPEGDPMPYRRIWWKNRLQILEVVLEREELTATGEWTNLTQVQKLPGTTSLIEDIGLIARNTASLESLAANALEPQMQRTIRQPAYYRAMAGREWKSPVELAEDDASPFDQQTFDVLQERLLQAEEKLVQINADKEERENAVRRVLPAYVRSVTNKEKEIENLKDQLRAMGHIFSDDQNEPDDSSRFGVDEIEKTLFDDDAIPIWAHDITAVPGATYRYRLAVVMNNPLFGRQATIHEEQHALAAIPLALGEMSQWTSPVEVDSMEYFFVTSASGSGQGELATGAKATVDVFRFYYGFWRKGSAGLKPGDLIQAEVSNPDNLYTFDFDAAPKDASGEVVPAALEPMELDEDGNPTDPPAWFVPVQAKMAAIVNAQFLNVSRIPGEVGSGIGGISASRPKFQAVLGAGLVDQLFVRNPAAEKASDRYQRLSRSADLGATQGQPVVKKQQESQNEIWGPQTGNPEEPEGGGGGG